MISLSVYRIIDGYVVIYIAQPNEWHEDHINELLNQNQLILYRANIPIALYRSLERECMLAYDSFHTDDYRTYCEYDDKEDYWIDRRTGPHTNGYTYNDYVQSMLNENGTDYKSKRKVAKKKWFKKIIGYGPSNMFNIIKKEGSSVSNDDFHVLIYDRLTTALHNATTAKMLTRLSYDAASRLACFTACRSTNSSLDHAISVIERAKINATNL